MLSYLTIPLLAVAATAAPPTPVPPSAPKESARGAGTGGEAGEARPPAAAGAERGGSARPTVMVVVGAAGASEYGRRFERWAERWKRAAREAGAAWIPLGAAAPGDEAGEASDRTRIRRELGRLAGSPAGGPIWLVFIGHGTFDGRTANFNLRGPDLSAAQLAAWLKPIDRPLAVLQTASASAPFLPALSAPGRVVLTATRGGRETSFARFGGFLADAVADRGADLDKDGRTSLLEAFLAASRRTKRFYESEGRLATEHALIDDNGDGRGTPADAFQGVRPTGNAAGGGAGDGARARRMHLVPAPADRRPPPLPPNLRARRDELEVQVFQLRDRKDQLSADEYYSRLEPLLVELARLYQQPAKPLPPPPGP